MLKELCLAVVFGSLSSWAKGPDLKNGPSGWQSFNTDGTSGFNSVHHKNSKDKGFKGDYKGTKVEGKADGKDMKAEYGPNDVNAVMDGDKANAAMSGNNYNAGGNGKTVLAETDGSSKVNKATAGGHQLSNAMVLSGKKTAYAENGRFAAKIKGSTGYAEDRRKKDRAKITGLKHGGSKVTGYRKGKKLVAGAYEGRSSRKAYAIVPNKHGWGSTRYTGQEQASGRGQYRIRVLSGKTPIYQGSVSGRSNSINLLTPSRGKKLATIKMNRYKDIPCQRFNDRYNLFAKDNQEFKYYDGSLTIDVPKKGGGYEWPTCMDIKAKFRIPPGIKLQDLAASLTVLIPSCGHLQCGQRHKCLGLECFYKDLCGDPNGKPSAQHKDAASWLLSQTTSDACTKNIDTNRDVDLVFKYCPDPNGKWHQSACVKDTLWIQSVASMEVQVDMYTVKKRPMSCNVFDPSALKNVKKRACKRVELDYSVKWLNLPDLHKFVKHLNKLTRNANCAYGKEMCLGT